MKPILECKFEKLLKQYKNALLKEQLHEKAFNSLPDDKFGSPKWNKLHDKMCGSLQNRCKVEKNLLLLIQKELLNKK